LVLDNAVAVYLVDEIGKMECLSVRFIAAMRALLKSPMTLVATVALKGSGFIAEIKQRKDSLLWEVTRENRDGFPARILAWLDRRGLPE
jgi:nucleoside-triphosphatase